MEQCSAEAVSSRQEKLLQILKNFSLMDDDFMTKVFENTACAELLLRVILERDDLLVQSVETQYTVKNLQGRSVRLDIYAVDADGQRYNVEVQRSDKGAGMRRARYNSSLMDANISEPGTDFQALPETYVIFITQHDVLREGLPIYHIERTIRETGKVFDEGTHILYVNSQIRDNSALGKLMHDFYCKSAEEMHYSVLANRVRFFKEDQKGVDTMCKAMEDWVVSERKLERRDANLQTATHLLSLGKLSCEEIALATSLTLDEVKALDAQRSA